ncbi:hypothetical protein ASZ90_002339 [hydrocarbon metagenome]|uniref:Uncharacterized protein n=1 Tax=hydrocarbon metagenome TaxID=938273 RepID=A0A0W8G3V3_9ZZZZ
MPGQRAGGGQWGCGGKKRVVHGGLRCGFCRRSQKRKRDFRHDCSCRRSRSPTGVDGKAKRRVDAVLLTLPERATPLQGVATIPDPARVSSPHGSLPSRGRHEVAGCGRVRLMGGGR